MSLHRKVWLLWVQQLFLRQILIVGHLDVVKLLLKHKANHRARNKTGKIALVCTPYTGVDLVDSAEWGCDEQDLAEDDAVYNCLLEAKADKTSDSGKRTMVSGKPGLRSGV